MSQNPMDRTLLWPSAEFLAKFIQTQDMKDLKVLEIGSGHGIPLLACNSTYKKSHDISGDYDYTFKWGEAIEAEFFDVILASDIFYDQQMYSDIFVTLAYFFRVNPNLRVIVGYQHRVFDDCFEPWLKLWNLKASILTSDDPLYIFEFIKFIPRVNQTVSASDSN